MLDAAAGVRHRAAMRLLAIETATEACSLALFDDGRLVASQHELLGRGHAERLVPLIGSLPSSGRASKILVSLGPGSFTGVRIGLAAARALGLAWGARVRGFPTLALVAATARHERPGPLSVCMNGGHGELFVQDFDGNGLPENDVRSLPRDEAINGIAHRRVAGNRAYELAELDGKLEPFDCLPDARLILDMPGSLLTDHLSALYGRGPDAKLPQ